MDEAADKKEQGLPANTTSGAPPFDSGTRNLRNLMALASALRRLALDSEPREATLYLSAATTLHRRAARLAGLPLQQLDEEDQPERPARNRRVDIHI